MHSLEEIIEKILKHHPQYDRKDILTMIKEKREELGQDVINDEAAAMIVARELGVDLLQDSSRGQFKIEDITEDKRNVALIARVMRLDTVRTFRRKDGSEGRVASLMVGDNTGTIRVVLWDDMTRAISEGHINIGDVIQIRGGYVKKGFRDSYELNIGRMGSIRVLEDYELEEFDMELAQPESTKIKDLTEGMYDVTILAKVTRVFNLSTFVRKTDGSEGKVLSVIGADGTGSIRIVFWDNFAEQMKDVQVGEVIRISGAYTRSSRNGTVEVHSGRSAVIERGIEGELESIEVSTDVSYGESLGQKRIKELAPDMRDVDVEAKVVRIFPSKEWKKDEREGKVQNIFVVDEDMQELRVTFWNETVDKVAELQVGDVIRIRHAYTKEREGNVELQAGRRAEIEINPVDSSLTDLDVGDLSEQTFMVANPVEIREINETLEGKIVEIRGIIVTMSQTRPIYLACPKCNKKVNEESGKHFCPTCGEVEHPDYRFAYSIRVDDGSETIMVTLFGKTAERLIGMTAREANKLIEETNKSGEVDSAAVLQDRILGKFILVRGRVNRNRLRNELDVTANYVEFPDIVEEIKRTKEKLDNMLV